MKKNSINNNNKTNLFLVSIGGNNLALGKTYQD